MVQPPRPYAGCSYAKTSNLQVRGLCLTHHSIGRESLSGRLSIRHFFSRLRLHPIAKKKMPNRKLSIRHRLLSAELGGGGGVDEGPNMANEHAYHQLMAREIICIYSLYRSLYACVCERRTAREGQAQTDTRHACRRRGD